MTYYNQEPFFGVDRAKWPNTWRTLVRFYFSGDWYQMTKFTNNFKGHTYYD